MSYALRSYYPPFEPLYYSPIVPPLRSLDYSSQAFEGSRLLLAEFLPSMILEPHKRFRVQGLVFRAQRASHIRRPWGACWMVAKGGKGKHPFFLEGEGGGV